MKYAYDAKTKPVVENKNGDVVFIKKRNDGKYFLAVIDVAGHGEHAHALHSTIETFLNAHVDERPENVLNSLDQELKSKRGAVGGICVVDENGNVECSIIGNVVCRVIGNNTKRFYGRDGLLSELFAVKAITETAMLSFGDTIVLHSDGIAEHFEQSDIEIMRSMDPSQITNLIMNKYSKSYDDASVIAFTILPDTS